MPFHNSQLNKLKSQTLDIEFVKTQFPDSVIFSEREREKTVLGSIQLNIGELLNM